MSEKIPPKIMEYLEKHVRSPTIMEQAVAFLQRIASGECVTWAEINKTSAKQHFQKMRALGLLIAVIRSGRRACLEFSEK